jgi:TRAP-type C4-dicarboxylate transport system permease small subunit
LVEPDLTNKLDRLVEWLMRICRYSIVAITGWLTLILIVSVFARFTLNYSLAWVDETSSLLLVWLMLAVAPLGFHENFHISLGILGASMPRKVQVVIGATINVATIAFFSITAYFGTISTIHDFSNQLFSIPIARGWATWILPVSSVLVLVVCLRNIVILIKKAAGACVHRKESIR